MTKFTAISKLYTTETHLRFFTHVGVFSKTGSDTSMYGKEQESGKKIFHDRAKNSSSCEGMTVEKHFLKISRNLFRKRLFSNGFKDVHRRQKLTTDFFQTF